MSDLSGLRHQYSVRKVGDLAGKHDACRYFVLDPQHDPSAAPALQAYAELVKDKSPELYADLIAWVGAADAVTVPKTEYASLKESARVLGLLERGGVDNWEWYGEALSGGLE